MHVMLLVQDVAVKQGSWTPGPSEQRVAACVTGMRCRTAMRSMRSTARG